GAGRGAPPTAEASSVTSAFRRAPGGAVRRQARDRVHFATCSKAESTRLVDVGELVADAPGREEQLGILRIAFDLVPEPTDHRVDGSLGDVGLAAPRAGEQRGAAEDDARSRGE